MRLFYSCLKTGNFDSLLNYFFLIPFTYPCCKWGSKDRVDVGICIQDKCSLHICGEKVATSLQWSWEVIAKLYMTVLI